MLRSLTIAACGDGSRAADEARFALVTKMLLVYPVVGASAESGRARGEAYRGALHDVAPWAVARAIEHWHRGECGHDEDGRAFDYRWAPAPAVLLRLARIHTEAYRRPMGHLQSLLDAIPLEAAMQPSESAMPRAAE